MQAPMSERERWNGPAGTAWVEARPMMDAMFCDLQHLLAGAVADTSARDVLDVDAAPAAPPWRSPPRCPPADP